MVVKISPFAAPTGMGTIETRPSSLEIHAGDLTGTAIVSGETTAVSNTCAGNVGAHTPQIYAPVKTITHPQQPPPQVHLATQPPASQNPNPEQTTQNKETVVTPIKVEAFKKLINGYQYDSYLIEGFTTGFRLGYLGPRQPRLSYNLPSALALPHIVDKKLGKEIELGRIQGPFNNIPFPNLQVSPIGCVPKKAPNEYRLIHHLSHPKGSSINSFVCDELATVSYASFDDAIKLLLNSGQNSLLAKTDLDSAFRMIPIHQLDHELLGINWRNQFFYDTCLPFGASSSCAIFERFSTGLQWIAQNKLNIQNLIHILDDFLFVGPPNSNKCQCDMQKFLSMCDTTGVPINEGKTVFPTTCITFLGLELDSKIMEARVPPDKLVKMRELLDSTSRKKKITLRELQSLIGFLNFCCTVIRPGRSFLRRLIDLTKKVSRPFHKITLNKESRRDIKAWGIFANHFNGKSLLIQEKWVTSPSLHLHTDAAGSLGYGAIFETQWLYGAWPTAIKHLPITFKELFPIVLAFEIWGTHFSNKCIMLHSDNYAVVHIINNQTSKDTTIMSLVRKFVLLCMRYNILTKAVHIPGSKNILPDLLSRFQIEEFKNRAPQMHIQPTPVPEAVLESLCEM